MRISLGLSVVSVLCTLACSGSTSSEPPASAASPASAPVGPTEPDRAKVTEHLRTHVKYPVSRADLLAACAGTNEFNTAEKQWFEGRVPEGSCASADAALKAIYGD